MLKPLSAFLLLLLFCFKVNATTPVDTTTKLKPKSQAWFHQQYGTDKTSKALIDFFFIKRENNLLPMLVLSAATVALSIVAISRASLESSPGDNAYAALIDVFSLVAGALIAVPLTILFIVIYTRYSRKRLMRTLSGYQSGKGLPKWLEKTPTWKKFVAVYPNK